MTLDRERYLRALADDARALLASAQEAGTAARVPACPDWSAGDLVYHVGNVAGFWASIVSRRVTEAGAVDFQPEPRPPDDGLLEWSQERCARLVQALTDTPGDTPVWTWASDHSAGFLVRRMAHEFAVHRVDAEQAAGRPGAVDAELASDGIDELLEHFLGPRPVTATPDAPPVAGSVHVHCTDVAGEWLLRFDGGTPVVTREHAKGDVALRGPASDLFLVLWHRRPPDAVEVLGDATVLEQLLARTSI